MVGHVGIHFPSCVVIVISVYRLWNNMVNNCNTFYSMVWAFLNSIRAYVHVIFYVLCG